MFFFPSYYVSYIIVVLYFNINMVANEVFDPHLAPLSLSKQPFWASYQKNCGGKGIIIYGLNRIVLMCLYYYFREIANACSYQYYLHSMILLLYLQSSIYSRTYIKYKNNDQQSLCREREASLATCSLVVDTLFNLQLLPARKMICNERNRSTTAT